MLLVGVFWRCCCVGWSHGCCCCWRISLRGDICWCCGCSWCVGWGRACHPRLRGVEYSSRRLSWVTVVWREGSIGSVSWRWSEYLYLTNILHLCNLPNLHTSYCVYSLAKLIQVTVHSHHMWRENAILYTQLWQYKNEYLKKTSILLFINFSKIITTLNFILHFITKDHKICQY